MNYPDKKELNQNTLIERNFKRKWPEFYNFLMNNYKDCNSLSEKLYLYYNGSDKRPVCKICGSSTKFINFFRGFRKYCSIKCSRRDHDLENKRIQTNLKIYGTKNPSQSGLIKEKIKQINLEKYGVEYVSQNKVVKEKVKQTNLERYGVGCNLQNNEVKEKVKRTNLERYGTEYAFNSDIVKEKIKQTNLEHYGVEYASQNEIIKEKIKQTNLEKYGVEYNLQNKEVKEKAKQTNLKKYGVEYASQNEIIKEKIKQTNLERYGVEYVFNSDIVKEKAKQTNLKKYGEENPFSSDIIKEKIKQTNLERYGGNSCMCSEKIKEKAKRTNLERYGVEHASQNKEVKGKIKQTNREINITTHPDLIRYTENGDWVCRCPHAECNKCTKKEYVINHQNYHNRNIQGTELCTKLLPIQSLYSTPELQIRNFLDSLNIAHTTNDRSVIPPKELDIYIPSKNIAIEFNGSYWHSNKDKYYHQNKTKACYSKGILLVHIYECEWNKDKESILSKLKDILEGKEVDGIVSVKDYDKYALSEPVLIDCGNCQYWNEGEWQLK